MFDRWRDPIGFASFLSWVTNSCFAQSVRKGSLPDTLPETPELDQQRRHVRKYGLRR